MRPMHWVSNPREHDETLSVKDRLHAILENEFETHIKQDEDSYDFSGYLDSLAVLEIISNIEYEFKIRVAEGELRRISTLVALTRFVEAKLAARPSPCPSPDPA